MNRTQLLILKSEVDIDPLSRGYSGMTDEEIANSLNTVFDRTRNKLEMTGSEILNAITESEYDALTDAQKDRTWQILHLGIINPFGIEKDLFTSIFGGGSQTITDLATLRVESINRATELLIPFVHVRDVVKAELTSSSSSSSNSSSSSSSSSISSSSSSFSISSSSSSSINSSSSSST